MESGRLPRPSVRHGDEQPVNNLVLDSSPDSRAAEPPPTLEAVATAVLNLAERGPTPASSQTHNGRHLASDAAPDQWTMITLRGHQSDKHPTWGHTIVQMKEGAVPAENQGLLLAMAASPCTSAITNSNKYIHNVYVYL